MNDAEQGFRDLIKTEDFYQFLCSPEKWAAVFGIGVTREQLAQLIMTHVTADTTTGTDPEVASIVRAEIDSLKEEGVSLEASVEFMANVLNYTAMQFFGDQIRAGRTLADLQFTIANI